jgi:enoyl-CoA hydratase/carnithine racemase
MEDVLQRARTGTIERLWLNRSEGENTLYDSLHDALAETSRELTSDAADRSRAPW